MPTDAPADRARSRPDAIPATTTVVLADVLSNHDLVRRTCIQITGDRTRADDLVQEAFVSALHAGARLEPRDSITAWLATVAHRRHIDGLRRYGRQVLMATPPEPTRRTTTDPADDVVAREFVEHVRRAMDGLADRERRLLFRQATFGMSLAELADEEQTSVASVRSVLARARRKLRTTLERNGMLGTAPFPTVVVGPHDKLAGLAGHGGGRSPVATALLTAWGAPPP